MMMNIKNTLKIFMFVSTVSNFNLGLMYISDTVFGVVDTGAAVANTFTESGWDIHHNISGEHHEVSSHNVPVRPYRMPPGTVWWI